jgi:hypothetical protein
MNELDVKSLKEKFPLEPIPRAADLTDSFGNDVQDDLSILQGKRWDQIDPSDFRFHFEIVCWLTPSAFRYYLPAIIACSIDELRSCGHLSETELVVDYTLKMLVRAESEKVETRYSEMWSALSGDQMRVVRKWVSVLAKQPEALPISSEDLSVAIDERECGR